jgi:hypothetical protein
VVIQIFYKYMSTSAGGAKLSIVRQATFLLAPNSLGRLVRQVRPRRQTHHLPRSLCLGCTRTVEVHVMDVITSYLLGKLEQEIYMMLPEGFIRMGTKKNMVRGIFVLRLCPQTSGGSLKPEDTRFPHQIVSSDPMWIPASTSTLHLHHDLG